MKKRIHLEIIRILALLCIVYDHTGDRGSTIYTFTNGNITFMISLISAILCKIGVPLFFMISGALLLKKQESWKDIYKKRVMRIVGIILIFTCLRYVYECFAVRTTAFSLGELIRVIITGDLFLPYWFLYAYLSILLILPFLKNMIKHMKEGEERLFFILIVAFGTLLPLLNAFTGQTLGVDFVLGENVGYWFLGYFLEHSIQSEKRNARMYIAISIGIVSCVLSYYLVIRESIHGGMLRSEYISILSMPLACAVFYIIKEMTSKIEEHHKGKITSIIMMMGSCVFGIYLIEDYLRNGLAIIWDWCSPRISALPACAIWLFAVFIVGTAVVSILKKLPILRKLL